MAAAAVVAGSATGVLAAPASAPAASVAVSELLAPVFFGEATATGVGAESLRFSARTVGAASWDLLNDVAVSGRAAYQQLPAGVLSIGQAFEYQVSHCDDTGCTASGIDTGHVSPELAAGARPGATRLPFTVGDRVSAQVDVGTGNLLVTTAQLSLSRVAGSLDLGLAYNGQTLAAGSAFESSTGPGWRFTTGRDVRLRANGGHGSVTYFGPNGQTGTFLPVAGSPTTYTAPPGMKATLTAVTGGWTLLQHDTGDTQHFDGQGRLSKLTDRNSNETVFTYNGAGALVEIQADKGTVGARTVAVLSAGYGDTRIRGLAQTPAGTPGRSVDYGYDSSDTRLVSITDVLGRTTSFGYSSAGDLTSITAPGGAETTFTYDAAHRVTTVTQPSDAPGDAVTRLVYNPGQTLVADPNTDPGQAVAAVPHTTYDLKSDGMLLAETATDPTGAQRSATFTPFMDVASSTNSSGTTTFGYDPAVNGGQSLTSTASATGAGSSYTYGNAAPAQYQPDSGTDTQGNASTFTYDGAGNGLSSANAGGATAEVTRNPDGTVATSVSPSGATMAYGYDANRQLTSITPPAGNSLGNRAYTHDAYGRIATYTSGRGVTETYTYDFGDRVLEVDFSDATPSVSYSYDAAGQVATRTDGSGVTTYTYDPLGRLASRAHTAGGGLLTYGYDLVGNLAAETDGGGTTAHSYDDRNLLETTETPDGRVIGYGYDADGKRTDTWFATNTGNTTWAAHTHTDYDASSRVTRVWTARAGNDATRVSDLSYSYASPGTGAGCATAPAAGADTGLRWAQTDSLTGQATSYCYDQSNRLVSAATAGGDSWSYSYDVNGNRTQTTKNGAVVQSQTPNSADQLTGTGYGYDASGNLTGAPGSVHPEYNGSEQMTAVTGHYNGTYSYAGTTQNELISQVVPGGSTWSYTWGRTDTNGLPLLESVTNVNGASYLTHDNQGTPLAFTTYTGGTSYYALDGLGSPLALINTRGVHIASYSYDPYGTVTVANHTGNAAADLQPYRFTGGLTDRTTGYLKMGQRWYDPTTGRFTQQDALETLADPTRANRYEYAVGNPTNYIDLTGQDWSWVGAALGFATSLLSGIVCGGLTFAATKNPVLGYSAGVACGTVVGTLIGGFTSD